MNRWIISICLALLAVSSSFGQDYPKRIYCPYCHHWMTQKRTREHFIAVKPDPNGPTYYCCRCDMPKKWFVKKFKQITGG